jgi:transcriptional regulator with XRE-family HTH domain
MNLGLAIWKERDRRGLDQQHYADLCGLSRTYISQIENNRRTVPLKTLMQLAAGFGLSTSRLVQLAEDL